MSVELRNVTKRIAGGHQTLFENLNLRVDKGVRVGILGPPKSGKSTLLRLICGTEPGYEGVIERSSSVSWPVSFGDFLVGSSTVATNIRFIGRLCGMRSDNFAREIGEIAGITEFLNEELANCPSFVRQQLSFALGIGTKFDIYLFDDNVVTGQKEFREKALEMVKSLTPEHGIVFATSVAKEIATHCDTVFILEDGQATYYEDVKEGTKHYNSLVQNTVEEPSARPERSEAIEEDMTSVLGI